MMESEHPNPLQPLGDVPKLKEVLRHGVEEGWLSPKSDRRQAPLSRQSTGSPGENVSLVTERSS
jgi:hypothetical protein